MTTTDPPPEARIVDRSLTHVAQRQGRSGAMAAVFQATWRRLLGLRRPARTKAMPIIFAAIAYAPAVAFIGIAAIIPTQAAQEVVPDPVEYYGLVLTAVILFVALVGPQALAPDRRHRTITLHLASLLTRTTYLVATGGALLAALLVVTIGPPLLVQFGVALLDVPGPAIVTILWRGIVGGTVLAVVLGSVGMAVSSLTDNRAFAAAGTFLTLIGLGIIGGVFQDPLDWPAWTAMVDVVTLTIEAVARVYGQTSDLADLSGVQVWAGVTVWVAGMLTLIRVRYGRIGVHR